jgi:protein involved in polysaccharide export with SLBB domain
MSNRMTRRLTVAGFALLTLVAGCASRTQPATEMERPSGESFASARAPGYRLREGDVVEVTLASDPESKFATPVTPEGTLTVPMGGEVVAAGRTTSEVAAAIEEALSGLYIDARASVVLRELAEQPVFVIGEVTSPGRVTATGHLTVSMAIADAGGIKSSGKASSVMVVRTYGVEEPTAIRVDLTKVLSGRDLAEDIELTGNDVVYVPKSVIGQIGEFVDLFFNSIAPAQVFYLRGYDMFHLGDVQYRY